MIKNNKTLAENSNIDNNKIITVILLSYFFKTLKLVVIIITVSYFVGIGWFILCELTYKGPDEAAIDENIGFYGQFELDKNSKTENLIIVFYYIFTTLATVGFGDFHPRSNVERLVAVCIFLFGVSIFSYIMNQFIEILI